MSAIRRIRKAVHARQVMFSDHALEEMDNDALLLHQIRSVLLHGAIHARHEDDPRGIRYVVCGNVEGEDVDVVCRFLESDVLWIITVYIVGEPDDDQ